MQSVAPSRDYKGLLSIEFPRTATVGIIDSIISTNQDMDSFTKTVLLDFSNSEFIDVPGLIYILSFVSGRQKEQKRTFLRLPNQKDTRDFLRAWNFPNAVRDVTGLTFWDSVTDEDHDYFGEDPDLGRQKYSGPIYLVGGKWYNILSRNYFSIKTFQPSLFNSSLALEEASRWKRQVISSVLEKVLVGPESYFASRIIFEAIMNAVRHPKASIIQTASHLNKIKKQDTQINYLTVVFWDDGESIIDTLKLALHEGKRIRSFSPDELNSISYLLRCKNHQKKLYHTETVNSNFEPDLNSSDEHFLLSSTFPGITRDALGKEHISHPDIENSDPIFSQPGMGLYLLVNAAINIYEGSVTFRTRNYFLSLRKSHKKFKEDILAGVTKYPEKHCFLGNLLTIRLPILNRGS